MIHIKVEDQKLYGVINQKLINSLHGKSEFVEQISYKIMELTPKSETQLLFILNSYDIKLNQSQIAQIYSSI